MQTKVFLHDRIDYRLNDGCKTWNTSESFGPPRIHGVTKFGRSNVSATFVWQNHASGNNGRCRCPLEYRIVE